MADFDDYRDVKATNDAVNKYYADRGDSDMVVPYDNEETDALE